MRPVDTLLSARWIVPIEPEGVLENHTLAIHDGRIVDILPQAHAQTKYTAEDRLALPSHALLPGLVNAHTHVPMTLLRGLADDLPLMDWLNHHIWPTEARWISDEFVRDGTRLAMAEMLRGGITCFNDMYFFPEVIADAVRAGGMRACVGLINVDFPSAWARDADEYLSKGLALHATLRDDPLICTAFAPHAPYTVNSVSLRRIQALAEELALPVHMHVHETAAEVEQSVSRHGRRPLAQLDELGLITPRLAAVHMTQLDGAEIARIAEAGVSVVHCPESNLKLASGFCPVAQLDAAGVNVALGTDGAASNNDLDLFGEIRIAALVGKGIAGDATALSAQRVLRMATLNGARAIGLADEIGTLEPGKWADITAVDLAPPESQPIYNPISQLVYATGRHQVSDVWVAGRRLLHNRTLTTLDLDAITDAARTWGRRIGNQHG
jgi:5-methylthioadenosine/S-adenosylhomocysteine deaminase